MRTTTETTRMLNPPHPGDFIKTEILEPSGLTVTAAAEQLQVSRSALSHLLNANVALTADMAYRIEQVFSVKMDTLLRMQTSYDIAAMRKRAQEEPGREFFRLARIRFKDRALRVAAERKRRLKTQKNSVNQKTRI